MSLARIHEGVMNQPWRIGSEAPSCDRTELALGSQRMKDWILSVVPIPNNMVTSFFLQFPKR